MLYHVHFYCRKGSPLSPVQLLSAVMVMLAVLLLLLTLHFLNFPFAFAVTT